MNFSVDSMLNGLAEQGMCFTSSEQRTTGEYDSADAEWNYKDVPHLKEAHENAEAINGALSKSSASSIFIQKVGPIRIPLSVCVYSPGPNSISYFTSIGPFVLVISSSWKTLLTSTTVTTRYHLGSTRFFKPFHFFIHKILEKNYKVLMNVDVPMRVRRGELRSRGYIFLNDESGYGFLETINLQVLGVKVPTTLPDFKVEMEISDLPQGTTLLGENDSRGIRIIREENQFRVFPRICLHAGALLDDAKIEDNCVRCPWHGKRIKAIFDFNLDDQTKSYESSGFKMTIEKQVLRFEGLLK